MPLSEEKIGRVWEAVKALKQLREEYADVLVVLDYVTLSEVAKFQMDPEEAETADSVLSGDELAGIVWQLGKHIGGHETSIALLPALVRYALDEHERRETQANNPAQ
jgi:hypothetical protein